MNYCIAINSCIVINSCIIKYFCITKYMCITKYFCVTKYSCVTKYFCIIEDHSFTVNPGIIILRKIFFILYPSTKFSCFYRANISQSLYSM